MEKGKLIFFRGRRLEQRLKEAGICRKCQLRLIRPPSTVHCQTCRRSINQTNRDRYRAEKGIVTCRICTLNKAMPGKPICQACKDERDLETWRRYWSKRGAIDPP